MREFIITAAKFGALLLLCAIGCAPLWGRFATDTLYNCTDPGGLDFLLPGHGVHHPVSVAHIVAGGFMSEPDTIRVGWNITGLWCLWFSFVVISFVVSFLLARGSWFPGRQREQIYEQTNTSQSCAAANPVLPVWDHGCNRRVPRRVAEIGSIGIVCEPFSRYSLCWR